MTRAGIVGLGLWAPAEIRSNDAWPESFTHAFLANRAEHRARDFTVLDGKSEPRKYEALYVKHATQHEADPFKGATHRRVTPAGQPSVVGDAEAATSALRDAGIEPRDVDLLLSSALVPDHLCPSNGPGIQHLTGCVNAAAIGVESYCAAAITQLELAAGLVESGRARFVLCVQSHQIARVNDMELPFSPMFGDASSAFVVGAVPEGRGLIDVARGGDGGLSGAITFVYKAKPDAVWWRDAQGPVVPGAIDFAASRAVGASLLAYPIDTIGELCRKASFSMDSAAALCMQQPLSWFQAAVAEGLGIPLERAPSTHAKYAHIGAPGVVANLIAARERGLLKTGAPVVLYAHGAGVTRYAALLRW